MSADKPDVSGIVNPSQRTLCVLVLDASGSMTSVTAKGTRRIDELNEGLRRFQAELHGDPVAKLRVRVAIVSVGGPGAGGAAKMMDWTDAMDFQAFDLTCGGDTPLGRGVEIALDMIRSEMKNLGASGVPFTRPWLFVMTDGQPTDSTEVWARATEACKKAEGRKLCVTYPIGVGGADMRVLQEISATRAQLLDETKFVEFFVWLSASLSAASQSAPGQTAALDPIDPWKAVQL